MNTEKNDWNTNTYKDLSFMDSLYLCMTSFSSVGYGDITPASNKAKIILVILHMFIILEILSISQYFNGGLNTRLIINITIIFVVMMSATLYFTFGTDKKDWSFPASEDTNSFLNMFYFTNSTLTTCGYGEIVPVTGKSKIPVMFVQFLIILQVLSLFH
jgi:hypothetical protein